MRYFVNKPITYTAVPNTSGYQPSDHTIRWTFDDGFTLDGFTVVKSWSTPGDHTAIATATNTITHGSGIASKVTLFIEYASTPGPMLQQKSGHRALQLASGEVMFSGGTHGSIIAGPVEFYDPVTGRTQKTYNGWGPRSFHGAIRLNDDRVVFAGGGSEMMVETYDPNAVITLTY